MVIKKGRKTLDSTVADAHKIATVWKDNPKLDLGETVGLKDFQQSISDTETADADYVTKALDFTAAKILLQQKVRELRALITRARSGFRAQYGPDSTQYEQSGAKRSSQRKKPTRTKGKQTSGPAQN